MVKSTVRRVETIKFSVHVSQRDIDEGECLDANKCMVRVANERKLRVMDPSMPNHHSRVDAGHIRFNLDGHRWSADTHRSAKAALITFDLEDRARRKAKRAGKPFKSSVTPFTFAVVATRGAKLEKASRERKDQINAAREARQAAGQKPKHYTLHKRVAGFA
jgi:hypothetical protein